MDEPTPQSVPVSLQERMTWPARVQVTVARRDSLSMAPANVWFAEFTMPRADTFDLRDRVESLVDQSDQSYQISVQSGRTSWGGDSGEIMAVVLYVSGMVTQAAIEHQVGDLFSQLRQRRQARATAESRPLSREEAISRARWSVADRYAATLSAGTIDVDGLDVVGESEDRESGAWAITLMSDLGWTFQVTLRIREGLVTIDRLDANRER
ncbi:hypothetical protein NIE79_001432 [Micromonospora sp. NIE79]|uniref:Uncharacterized protein n=1 Tax=Micromonospora trifolii TaxID=2911208 RepID=A0ABS9MV92_9ACTN|nr:hypothetical protein [Micromonospora trifolii]MCG5441310.1 hypothetical protein [Micromonospora trifolii]